MNDIENEVFSMISLELREAFPNIFVVGEALEGVPTRLPCAAIYESDSFSPSEKIDSSGTEKYTDIAFQVSAYSNKATGKKDECKRIVDIVDRVLFGLNFTRVINTPQVLMNEGKIYWKSARYTARTDGKRIFRR